ncbi:MAG: hypothetical protein HW386_581 [Gammaproteobacteria bacterium]|nr:hypothetical protein [Gammaproteobacteria bacterium]
MKNIVASVVLAAVLVYGAAVDAASWYQVEVIVFDYLNPNLDGELWFDNPGLPPRDNCRQHHSHSATRPSPVTVGSNGSRRESVTNAGSCRTTGPFGLSGIAAGTLSIAG